MTNTESDALIARRFEACERVTEHIDEFIEDYEFDDGETTHHIPSDAERGLIYDAVSGLMADEEFVARYDAWRALCPTPTADRIAALEAEVERLTLERDTQRDITDREFARADAATERAQAAEQALRKLRAGVSVITPEDAIALIDAALAVPQGEP